MKDRTPSDRIKRLQRYGLLSWSEPINGGKQKLIRTCGKRLQGRWRIRSRVEPMIGESSPCSSGRLAESVRRSPWLMPAMPSAAERASQVGIQLHQVTRPSRNSFWFCLQQRLQCGQVMLNVVDGVQRIGWCWPCEQSIRFLGRLSFKYFYIREMPQRRSGDVKGIERRHSGSRQSNFDLRVREIYLPTRSSSSKP